MARVNLSRPTGPTGGVLSFVALLAGAFFLGLAVFGLPFAGINEVDAGLFSWACAWVLERCGA